MVVMPFLAAGCGSGGSGYMTPTPQTASVTHGDWNDVTASVFYAATKTEMALVGNGPTHVEQSDDGSTRAVYLLYTIMDAEVHFEVRTEGAAEAGAIQVFCRAGRFTDSKLEKAFILAFKKRLLQLEGRDALPIG